MRRLLLLFLIFPFFIKMMTAPVHAAISVLACEPEWDALVAELAGKLARSTSATTGRQDPHRIEARPSLIARVRNADLLVCTGLGLEAGWLPVLLQQSGNRRIQPGQPGYLIVGPLVPLLDIPASLDRAAGDVHGGGNPHVQLDPRNILIIAGAVRDRLAQLDPANAAQYAAAYTNFRLRWEKAMEDWQSRAGALAGLAVITHHKDMVYLSNWLGLRELGYLEPRPGLEPSSAHLAELLQQLRGEPARLVLRAPYQSERASRWLADQAGMTAVMLPNTVGGSDEANDLFQLFDDIMRRLTEASR